MTEPSPPPAGEVPPLTEFAWRHRLVRPVQGRTLAGVCGAFARATGTDPVLWRVVLVVLAFFGGIGALIYLLAWLLLPADGDTATPLEALAGRGRSRTSTIRTVIGVVIVAIAFAGYFSEPYRATPLIALLLLGGVLLLLVRDRPRSGEAARPAAYVPVVPPGTPEAHAPHGPFTPPVSVPPVPPVPWPPHPLPPRPPRSRLGGLTLSLALVTVGGLGVADLAGVSVPTLAYIAAPLGVLGAGLIVGTWVGRARWLIPFGLVLSLALGGGYVALVEGHWNRPSVGTVTYTPTSVAEVADRYHRNAGDVTLDLSEVDFSGRDVEVSVRVDFGTVTVELPSDVDVVVDASVGVGDAEVLGEQWDGVGNDTHTISDLGRDGTGGGKLHLVAKVGFGTLEVRR